MKVCANCNREFHRKYTSKSLAPYCSTDCAKRDNYRATDLSVKLCKKCNKGFRSAQSRQVYCSETCSSQVRYQNVNALRKITYWDVLSRDNFQCQYCGKTPTQHGITLHIDHIKPKSDGGKDKLDNLVTACSECNLHKSHRPLICEVVFKQRLQQNLKRMNQQHVFKFFG